MEEPGEVDGESSAARRRPSRWRRRLAVTGGLLVAFGVALRIALPPVLERAVPIVAERFGFAAELANVDLSLLRGHVTLEGLRVAPLAPAATGAAPPDLLRLARLFADVEWLALFRREVDVAELRLEQPELALVRAADGFLELPVLPPSPEPAASGSVEGEPSEPLPIRLRSFVVRDSEFRLQDGSGGSDLLTFRLKELGLGDLRLVGATLGLGEIRISEPRLVVRREVQHTRTGARDAAPAPAPAEAAAGDGETAPPELRIDRLEIERAEFSVVTAEGPVTLALHLKTSGVSLAPNTPFPLDFAIEAGQGSVSLLGQLGLNPLAWEGKVAWRNLAVPLLVRAALPGLVSWIRSCAASGDLDVKLTPEAVRASGRVGVDDFTVEDPMQELALGWKSLAIELREATLPLAASGEPIQLTLAKVSLDAPSARYALPNTALERLLATGGSDAGAPVPEAEEPALAAAAPAESAAARQPRIAIDTIEVRRGAAEFVDRSGGEPYQGRIRDLALDAANVKLPERTVERLRVRGLAPERAPFDLEAALPGAEGTMSFKLERLPLAQFTPYAARAAEIRIPKGDLSLETSARLERAGAAGKVDTKVRVHQLAIAGGRTLSVAGLPLGFVLALLRDPQGDIELPVPLEYGEQGASADIGAILGGALQAAIKGAATSPLKAAGALLPQGGGGEISFDPIVFAAGSAEVPSDAAARVAPLARLLAERPGLGLALVGSSGPEDRLALGERLLVERVATGGGLPEVADAGFIARRRVRGALEARGRGEEGALDAEDAALLARYVEATEVPAERYAELARRRADALRGVLQAEPGLAAGRVLAEVATAPGAPEVAIDLRFDAAGSH